MPINFTYSYLPNKLAGPNKRVGWKIGQHQIIVQGKIIVLGGKMLKCLIIVQARKRFTASFYAEWIYFFLKSIIV